MSEILPSDLVNLAVQYRAMAASVFNADKDEYHRLEAQADELYSLAEDYGLEFDEIPRLDGTSAAKPKKRKPCEQCGGEFVYRRKTARFCSKSCRQKHAYREEAA